MATLYKYRIIIVIGEEAATRAYLGLVTALALFSASVGAFASIWIIFSYMSWKTKKRFAGERKHRRPRRTTTARVIWAAASFWMPAGGRLRNVLHAPKECERGLSRIIARR